MRRADRKTHLLPPLTYPVQLIGLRLSASPANILRAVQLVLAPLPYFVLSYLWPNVLDRFIFPVLDR